MYKYGIEDVSDFVDEWGIKDLQKELTKKDFYECKNTNK
jgi:hypothetical protein